MNLTLIFIQDNILGKFPELYLELLNKKQQTI